MLTLLRRFALRHLLRAPLRAGLVAFGITLGVALQVASRATSDGMLVAFEKMVQQISGKSDVTIRSRGGALTDALTADLLDVPGVAHAAALVEVTVRDEGTGRPLLILGADFLGDPYFLPFEVSSGERRVTDDPLSIANDPRAILVSRTLAERKGLRPGGELRLVTAAGPAAFHVRGIVDDAGPASAFDGQVVVMFIDAAQLAFARGHAVDRIEVALASGADRHAAIEQLRKVAGAFGDVERPEERGQRISSLVAPLRISLELCGLLALFVAMFQTYNAVGIAVAQRRSEIGVVRALGATRAAVVAVFCVEALVLALPATALGVVLGKLFARVAIEQTVPTLSQLVVPIKPFVPEVGPRLIAQAVGAGLLATLVAAFAPALRAARIDPALAMRGSSVLDRSARLPVRTFTVAGGVLAAAVAASTALHSLRLGVGAVVLVFAVGGLFAPGLLLVLRALVSRGFLPAGAVVRLGVANASRDLGRSVTNVTALTAAVTLSVTLGVWVASVKHSISAWYEDALSGDLSVVAGSPVSDRYHVPFADDVVEKLRKVANVEGIVPYRAVLQRVEGVEMGISAFDTRTYGALASQRGKPWATSAGVSLDRRDLASTRTVALTEDAARLLHRKPGDRIALQAPHGLVEFEVGAVVGRYLFDRPAILVDRRWMVELWDDRSVDYVDLFVRPGADVAAIAESTRAALGGGEALFVMRTDEVKGELVRMVDQTFVYAHSIELVTLLVALMGVTSTMLAVVLDRRREIGLLRAIGGTRPQVALAVTTEAAALGVAAALLGVACGALQGYVVVESVIRPALDWRLDYVFSAGAAARIGSLVVLTALLAGVLPAYRAARVEIVRAVGHE